MIIILKFLDYHFKYRQILAQSFGSIQNYQYNINISKTFFLLFKTSINVFPKFL